MAKYKSRGGVEVDAHVVTKEEKQLQLPVDGGIEWLKPGDVALTIEKQSFKCPGALFEALFTAESKEKAAAGAEPKEKEPKPK